MTRIIAGVAGGRSLATPKGSSTRPTTDRVREALFSRLDSLTEVTDARVLDLYAGSGALGLEAASRGAPHVICVEADRSAARLIQRNVAALGLSGVQVRAERVERALRSGPGGDPYDVVVADPPYPLDEESVRSVLATLIERRWCAPQAILILERSTRGPRPTWPPSVTAVGSKSYGETTLHFARVQPELSRP